MAKTIIEINGLTKRYGGVTAVDNLNLQVQEGEVFGLLGPNGAGKTTTTLMLLGLTEPTEGSATIEGVDCTRDPIRVKRVVGYLPDNMGFYPDMTGRENLRMTGRMNGLRGELLEARIDELLGRMGMAGAADRRASTYSYGVDPEGIRELTALIRELADRDGRTILISSHQLHQIQQICDRVGIFVHGRLAACGRIGELAEQMEKENGYCFAVEAQPGGEALAAALRGVEGVETVEVEEGVAVARASADVRAAAAKRLVENGFQVTYLQKRGGDLDDIYARYFEKAGEINAGKRKDGHRARQAR